MRSSGCFLQQLQGFDPIEHSKQEFLEFCERLEATEDIFIENPSAKRKANTKSNYKTKEGRTPVNRSTRNPTGTSRFCRLHGQQQSHDTGSCKVLLNQADKMKANWKTQPSQYPKKRCNATPNKGTSFQKNSDSRYNSDFKK